MVTHLDLNMDCKLRDAAKSKRLNEGGRSSIKATRSSAQAMEPNTRTKANSQDLGACSYQGGKYGYKILQ